MNLHLRIERWRGNAPQSRGERGAVRLLAESSVDDFGRQSMSSLLYMQIGSGKP